MRVKQALNIPIPNSDSDDVRPVFCIEFCHDPFYMGADRVQATMQFVGYFLIGEPFSYMAGNPALWI